MKDPTIPGLDVTLRAGELQLPEFSPPSDEEVPPRQALNYVEAASGSFHVAISCDESFEYGADDLVCYVYLDGKLLEAGVVESTLSPKTIFVRGKRYFEDGRPFLKRFTFAPTMFTEDAANDPLKKKLKSLGEVKVVVKRGRVVRPMPFQADTPGIFENVASKGVPEVALKGRSISHHAKLGEAEPLLGLRCISMEWPHGPIPLAVFVFKYRTRRDLVNEGIIEESAPISPEDRDPESLSLDEAREQIHLLRKRLRDHEARDQEARDEMRRAVEHASFKIPVRECGSTSCNATDGCNDGEDIVKIIYARHPKRAKRS